MSTVTRRVVIGGLLAAGGVAVAGGGYYAMASGDYDSVLEDMTRPMGDSATPDELVRYATLAANSHNTQPWLFEAGTDAIVIAPDLTRQTPVVDPDMHHFFASLGCAAENMSIAARARGLSGEAVFVPDGDGRIRVSLARVPREETPLFAAIPVRQCTRTAYDGAAVPADVMARLEAAARVYGVEPIFIADRAGIESVVGLIVAGNSRQMDDPAFVRELKEWIRFNARVMAKAGDGIYSAASGNPNLPNWLGPIMFDLTVTRDGENARYAEQTRSSSGIVVFAAETNDKAGWIAAGRAYQRFALQATADGVKHAFVNQAVEVPEVRKDLQSLLKLADRRPNLVVRFGYAQPMPRSLRRPVADVLRPASV